MTEFDITFAKKSTGDVDSDESASRLGLSVYSDAEPFDAMPARAGT
jgi:hypothetical protein